MKIINQIINTTHDVKWLVDGFKKESISVNNDYQRRFVWTDKDKVKLIETILLGYSVPEIYLHKRSTNPESGETNYEIVDGQQRITSIFKFLNGEFSLNGTDLDSRFRGKLFSELTNDEKSSIWNYPFSIRVIDEEVSQENINQLFLRLNATDKSLNPQELRNASFNGEFLKLAEIIADDIFWSKIYEDKESIRRMQDVQFISEILTYFRYGIIANSQANINKAYDTYNDKYDEADEDREKFIKIIRFLEQLAFKSTSFSNQMKKNVHLYSMIVISDYILDYPEQVGDFGQKLISFYEEYADGNGKNPFVEEYRENSQDATGSKTKRVKRNTMLKKYITQ